MLFLHETHKVVGAREDEFEAAYREGWMPTLAKEDTARLLWYTNHAHGSGVSYNVVTITGITDGAAWERLARRAQNGDLKPWMQKLDHLRHEVTGKILMPVEWSPLQSVDLATVPTDGATHPQSLFMEDTGWPYAPLDDYIRSWDEIYYRPLPRRHQECGCSTSRRVFRWRTAAPNGEKRCCGRKSTRPTTTRRSFTC